MAVNPQTCSNPPYEGSRYTPSPLVRISKEAMSQTHPGILVPVETTVRSIREHTGVSTPPVIIRSLRDYIEFLPHSIVQRTRLFYIVIPRTNSCISPMWTAKQSAHPAISTGTSRRATYPSAGSCLTGATGSGDCASCQRDQTELPYYTEPIKVIQKAATMDPYRK
jgi:hypothetical protein